MKKYAYFEVIADSNTCVLFTESYKEALSSFAKQEPKATLYGYDAQGGPVVIMSK